MEFVQFSLIGNRKRNEDRGLILKHPHCVFMVIADGLGGYPHGDIAAQILIDACQKQFEITPKPIISPRVFFHECIKQAYIGIQHYIKQYQLQHSPRTTLVFALLQEGQCYWTHAGDSRFYLIRQNEIIHYSLDHTLEQQIPSLKGTIKGRMLTRCLSGDHLLFTRCPMPISLYEQDIILLCSDGFWSQIKDQNIILNYLQRYPLKEALTELARLAYEKFIGHSDNISVIAAQVDAEFAKMSSRQEQDLIEELDDLDQIIDKITDQYESKPKKKSSTEKY